MAEKHAIEDILSGVNLLVTAKEPQLTAAKSQVPSWADELSRTPIPAMIPKSCEMAVVSPISRIGRKPKAIRERMKREVGAGPSRSPPSSVASIPSMEGPHEVDPPEYESATPKRTKMVLVKTYTTREIILEGRVVKREEHHTERLQRVEVDSNGMLIV